MPWGSLSQVEETEEGTAFETQLDRREWQKVELGERKHRRQGDAVFKESGWQGML